MAPSDVNNSLNVGINNNDETVDNLRDENQQDGSTSETHLDANKSTHNQVERKTRHERSHTPNDMDDEPVVDTVKVLRVQQREIMNHFSRHDRIMIELQQAISGTSNTSNGGVRVPFGMPISQAIPGTGNIAS